MADEAQKPNTITTEQAGRLLMISAERVRQLSKEGWIPKVGTIIGRGRARTATSISFHGSNACAFLSGWIQIIRPVGGSCRAPNKPQRWL